VLRRWLLGLTCGLLALAGHLWFQYLPRARPGVPGGTPVAALLDDADFPAAVWVPYPHQNLARLRRAAGAEPESMRAVARLAGLPSPALPTFGPLGLPPSSEIAVASDEAGERFVVVAQVYPTVAAFAKLAGRLAGNPWLRGGDILVEGRPATVSWQGNRWTVASAGLSPDPAGEAAAAAPRPTEPGLAWIRIRQALDPLPAGLYHLSEQDGDLAITSSEAAPATASVESDLAGRLDGFGMFLLVYSGALPALGEPAQALAFFDQEEQRSMELPRVAALSEPGAERWQLPGESLIELSGRRPVTSLAGRWSITAFESTILDGARGVAPELDTVAERRLRWGLWLDFRGGLTEVERIAHILDSVPIASRRQVERWDDVRSALAPLAERYTTLTATVSEEPRVFDLRLTAVKSE
jgi:hypothetical protein